MGLPLKASEISCFGKKLNGYDFFIFVVKIQYILAKIAKSSKITFAPILVVDG